MSIIDEKNKSPNVQPNPRIRHFKVLGQWTLYQYINSFLQLDEEKIIFLLSFGAIYLNGKRIHKNLPLKNDDYLRVHIDPKRFQVPKNISELVLFEDESFIALNKIQGIPCHPTLDNSYENLLNLICLDRNQEYFLCHRLDIGTEGVLLFAKTKQVQTYMMQHWKEVKKIYRAQTQGRLLESQILQHWMQAHPRAPKILADKPTDNWQLCELQILNSKIINISESLTINEYNIELLTGRTHQIRAQLSFEQNPILGDIMYGSQHSNKSQYDSFALKCTEISFFYLDKNYHLLA